MAHTLEFINVMELVEFYSTQSHHDHVLLMLMARMVWIDEVNY